MNNKEAVNKWRRNTKKRIVESMGGCCQICGYNKCNKALELHHIDDIEKDFHFALIISNPKAWDKVVVELRKCILLCANCHREVHAGLEVLPDNFSKFDENYLEYKEPFLTKCPVCDKVKPERNRTCSRGCAAKIRYLEKIDWESIDLKEYLIKYGYNFSQVGRMLGVSDNAVRKRAKKLGIIE